MLGPPQRNPFVYNLLHPGIGGLAGYPPNSVWHSPPRPVGFSYPLLNASLSLPFLRVPSSPIVVKLSRLYMMRENCVRKQCFDTSVEAVASRQLPVARKATP